MLRHFGDLESPQFSGFLVGARGIDELGERSEAVGVAGLVVGVVDGRFGIGDFAVEALDFGQLSVSRPSRWMAEFREKIGNATHETKKKIRCHLKFNC